MILSCDDLRKLLYKTLESKHTQGYDIAPFLARLDTCPDSYDALMTVANDLRTASFVPDWPYDEPISWHDIQCAWDPHASRPPLASVSYATAATRIRTAFHAAVAGCILGKPLECDPTLDEIQRAAEKTGEWPLTTYVTEEMMHAMGRYAACLETTTRGNITYVAPDDDINYLILALLALETHGPHFSHTDILTLWLKNLPILTTFGPERTLMAKAAAYSLLHDPQTAPLEEWRAVLNPEEELCGAAIRVDTYGYAFPGNPYRAVQCAWKDASCTHTRTGVYAALFIAAAVATAFVAETPMDIFACAMQYIPQKSRFYACIKDCFDLVERAADWREGYTAIHHKYGKYGHCQLYQECGLLINSARFAKDANDAICLQVMQGCDTDCFGKIAGSIMGAYFGENSLDPAWLEPFNDRLYTHLADFHEQSLEAVTARMCALPARVTDTQS